MTTEIGTISETITTSWVDAVFVARGRFNYDHQRMPLLATEAAKPKTGA